MPPHSKLATNTHDQLPSSSHNSREYSSSNNPDSSNSQSSTQLTTLGSSSSSLPRFKNSYDSKRSKCKKSYVVSHMQLVMIWPPGYCTGPETCWQEIDMSRFSIHGLWPANEKGRHKESCELRFKEISLPAQFLMLGNEMIEQLREKWPSYQKLEQPQTQYTASPKFWSHEYLRRGSCADMSFGDYFRRVLERRADADLENWLTNLLDETNTIYTKETIAEAFFPFIANKNFYLSCADEDRLIEIILCVDNDGLEFISCPDTDKKFGCEKETVTFHKTQTF